MSSGFYVDEPQAPSVPRPIIDAIAPPEFKSAIVDTMYQPKSELLAYISGMTWVVDYYSRLLGSSEEAQGLDVSLAAPLQQYDRIWSMELKVQQDLQTTFDDAGGQQMTTGTAHVYPFLIPQVGDMFRVGINDGTEGMFRVTAVRRMSMFKDTVHEIDYVLVSRDDPKYIGNLDSKVQRTYYFVKDFLLNHQNPMVIQEDYELGQRLANVYYNLIYFYEKQYVSREFRTLIIPDQPAATYDHALTDFVMSTVEEVNGTSIAGIRMMNTGDDSVINSVSLWDMIMRRDPGLREHAYSMAGLTPCKALEIPYMRTALMSGMQWTNIRHVVYPIDPLLNVDVLGGWEKIRTILTATQVSRLKKRLTSKLWDVKDLPGFIAAADDPVPPPPPKERPLIHPVDFSKTYVLSQAFWDNDVEGMSLLEFLLNEYLQKKLLRNQDVLKLSEAATRWNRLDQFYLIPIVLLLLRYSIRRL